MQKKSSIQVTNDDVKKELYNRFIEPTTHGRKDFIGIEIEIPILNLDKKPVNFMIVHEITQEFEDHYPSFSRQNIDHDGHVCSLINKENGDIISYDCSYNNLEFSFGVVKNLFEADERFREYYNFFKNAFEKHNHTLTGIGINPYRIYNHHVPIPNERYRMLFHHLCSYSRYSKLPKYFHDHPEYGMFSSASQVQLDVEKENLVKTINVFSKLEPIKAILFSNSVLLGENEDLLCCRDMFWQDSTHGINPHNIGMYEKELKNIDELIEYIQSLNIYCTMRNGLYINFPTINIMKYFESEQIEGEYCDKGVYDAVTITPELSDIEYLRSFKFLDLTYRGTIEYRSACTQPISDVLTVAAFQLGLKYKLDELEEIFENDDVIYHQGYTASELRKLFVQKDLPVFVDEDKLYELIITVLDVCKDGLIERGLCEEKFIEPLYERAKNHTNPARKMLDNLDKGVSIEEIIKDYGTLN
ncbi:hypothetical protein [Methanosphaera sp.]